MSVSNRILKYLKEEAPQMARCIVVSDIPRHRVIVSYAGDKLLWAWSPNNNGLLCPGSKIPINVDRFAAEALVIEEVMAFLKMEGVNIKEIVYLNPAGERVDGIFINPPGVDTSDFLHICKKEKIKELYLRFIESGDKLSEELIGESIASGVLEPFLSLVNL